MALVTLLTDFGLSDPFVGEMKGVLASAAPDAGAVDLLHGVSPGNVREGAWVLERAWDLFPAGTCHVAVVDPGVGGSRRALAARAGGRFFVGPDNGVLAPALESAGDAVIRRISVSDRDRVRRGTTFDGRDVFVPVAARLVSGAALEQLGPEVRDPVRLAPFRPEKQPGGWSVEIIRVDRFGNLVTVAEERFLRAELGDGWRAARVTLGDARVEGISLGYGDVRAGETLLSIGGAGTLEISVSGGSAAETHAIGAGERVALSPPDED